jgi:hypothetical protein
MQTKEEIDNSSRKLKDELEPYEIFEFEGDVEGENRKYWDKTKTETDIEKKNEIVVTCGGEAILPRYLWDDLLGILAGGRDITHHFKFKEPYFQGIQDVEFLSARIMGKTFTQATYPKNDVDKDGNPIDMNPIGSSYDRYGNVLYPSRKVDMSSIFQGKEKSEWKEI